MFCPYCRQAKLSFILYSTNKKPHLKTAPKSLHASNCPYENGQQYRKITTEYAQTLTSKQIKNQLKSALRHLFNEQDDNTIVISQDNYKKVAIDVKAEIRASKSPVCPTISPFAKFTTMKSSPRSMPFFTSASTS